jgi:hypothetical protein
MWLSHLENSLLHELCFISINELCELACNVWKNRENIFLWVQDWNRAPLASNKLSLPLHYIQICVLSLHSIVLYLVLPPANCSHGRPSPGRPQPPSRAMTPASCNLPRNAAAAPWPQPPTQRSGCALRPGVPRLLPFPAGRAKTQPHSSHPQKLKVKH